eukprot:PhM_4_TR14084/c3_g1_i1/m.107020
MYFPFVDIQAREALMAAYTLMGNNNNKNNNSMALTLPSLRRVAEYLGDSQRPHWAVCFLEETPEMFCRIIRGDALDDLDTRSAVLPTCRTSILTDVQDKFTSAHVAALCGNLPALQKLLTGPSFPTWSRCSVFTITAAAMLGGHTDCIRYAVGHELEMPDMHMVNYYNGCLSGRGDAPALYISLVEGRTGAVEQMRSTVGRQLKAMMCGGENNGGGVNELMGVTVSMDAEAFVDVQLATLFQGMSLLHCAALMGNLPLARAALGHVELSSEGHVDNVRDATGKTAAHYAAVGGHVAILHLLFDAGANMQSTDINGSTPAHFAAVAGQVGAVHFLRHHGGWDPLLPLATDSTGRTLVHYAATSGRLETLRYLATCGIRTDEFKRREQGCLGGSPLLWATKADHKAVVLHLSPSYGPEDLELEKDQLRSYASSSEFGLDDDVERLVSVST